MGYNSAKTLVWNTYGQRFCSLGPLLRGGLLYQQHHHRRRRRLLGGVAFSSTHERDMTPRKDTIPHELRTAAEPRQNKLHTVRLAHIEQINPTIRLLRLTLNSSSTTDGDAEPNQLHQEPFAFLPGQWLDVHIPSIPQAGGFTITSTPADAQPLPSPKPVVEGSEPLSADVEGVPPDGTHGRLAHVELAVQKSPSNPPAAWLWRPEDEILGKEVSVRVGGSFIWPPAEVAIDEIRNVVFVAGGVGINPLISILSHLSERETSDAPSSLPMPDKNRKDPLSIHFLYSTRLPTEVSSAPSSVQHGETLAESTLRQILFLPRIRQIVQRASSQPSNLHISLDLFLTNLPSSAAESATKLLKDGYEDGDIRVHTRRITKEDLRAAASTNGTSAAIPPQNTVCYVCGPPPMTDEFVQYLSGLIGPERVLCEKWW